MASLAGSDYLLILLYMEKSAVSSTYLLKMKIIFHYKYLKIDSEKYINSKWFIRDLNVTIIIADKRYAGFLHTDMNYI